MVGSSDVHSMRTGIDLSGSTQAAHGTKNSHAPGVSMYISKIKRIP